MPLQWNDSLSVGYAAMDRQHQRLFAINSKLAEALGKPGGAGEEELLKIIGDLLSYTRTHFAEEERMMEQVAFPNFAWHKKSHEVLSGIVSDMEAKLRKGELHAVATFLPGFVAEWLTRHIAVEDQQYASYLKTRDAVQSARNWL